MRSGKATREAFEAFGEEADRYDRNYSFDTDRYPDHVYRLRIFEDLLQSIQPTTVLDAGCGSGVPLSTFLNAGFNAFGFDRSPEMVAVSQRRLQKDGHDSSRAFLGDLDSFQRPISVQFDAIVGLGSVYYTPNTLNTIKSLAGHLRPGGTLIVSLRNQLFSLCSLNEYSAEYLLREIFPSQQLTGSLQEEVHKYFSERFPKLNVEKLFENVDDRNIRSHLHNPLTVAEELLEPSGFSLQRVYYYHFHALPPVFEHLHQRDFYELSSQREVPTDWRGIVTASCFVVHATKHTAAERARVTS